MTADGRPALRLVLLGTTGSGRSASGNTILGRYAFPSSASPRSLTRRCQTRLGSVGGRDLAVTDTPGLFHTCLPPREVTEELLRGLAALAAPGPHAFLVTLRPGRYTQEERRALGWLRAVLGPLAPGFTLLLLTWGEEGLQGRRPEEFLEESEELREFAGSCRGGWHLLENRGGGRGPEGEDRERQVERLLEKVERMVEENGGGFYGKEMLQDAGRTIWEAQEERILEGEGSWEARGEEEEMRRGGRAAEGAGLLEKGAGPAGKGPGKVKALKKVATMATTPLSITSAARAVGGAVREGGRVLFKHRKTLLP
ncbi:unnamed protein product [Merluccius merluccius]